MPRVNYLDAQRVHGAIKYTNRPVASRAKSRLLYFHSYLPLLPAK